MNGYVGQLLRINLSNRSVRTEALNLEWARQYSGCSGIGARYLYEELLRGADALAPDNPIIIATGPLTGTIASGCPKYAIVTKSPLSGGLIDSTAGGGFGPELKYAGYDLVIIEGQSEDPVYVVVRDGSVEIKDAYRLWGKTVGETEDALHEWFGESAQVLSIGPAGENLVRFAAVMTGYYRAHGRGGVGAVFGSKKLKALVVRGSGGVGVAEPDAFAAAAQRALEEGLVKNPSVWASRPRGGAGTQVLMPICQEYGCLSTRNYAASTFAESEQIGQEASMAVVNAFRSCTHCSVACKGHVHLTDTPWGDIDGECPEFETWALLGANCLIGDLPAVVRANEVCNNLGMDTMTAGSVLSWAMECRERGLLDDADIGDMDLSFGSVGAVLDILEDIAMRRGLGDLLAEGVQRASQRVGHESDHFAMHVKGMGLPAYDPRASVGMGLGYATAAVGAHHTRAFTLYAEMFEQTSTWLSADRIELDQYSPEHKGKLVAQMQDFQTYRFNSGACDFVYGHVEEGWLTDMVEACTGWHEERDHFRLVGERFYNLAKMFNLREGLSRKDDSLPRRLFEEVLPDGPSQGHKMDDADFAQMLDDYYEFRGWDKDGRPGGETLARLGIADLAIEEGGRILADPR